MNTKFTLIFFVLSLSQCAKAYDEENRINAQNKEILKRNEHFERFSFFNQPFGNSNSVKKPSVDRRLTLNRLKKQESLSQEDSLETITDQESLQPQISLKTDSQINGKDEMSPAETSTSIDKLFNAKSDELKFQYDKSISSLRTESLGSEKFLTKKAMHVEQLISNMIRYAESILNTRIDYAYASIEAKAAETENYLRSVGNQIYRDLANTLRNSQSEFLNLILKEKALLESESVILNEKIKILYKDILKSDELTSLIRFTGTNSTLSLGQRPIVNTGK